MVEIKVRLDNDDHYAGGNTHEYIVIHGTGNQNDSDEGNANYFCTGSRGASAHDFVDDDSITHIVDYNDCSWHCGDGHGAYGITNTNSIGIEMCCTNGIYSDKTVFNTIELVASLMKKYNIPLDKVVRHYDASRKNCPSAFNLDGNWTKWYQFKQQLADYIAPKPKSVVYDVKFLQTAINVVVDGIAGRQTLGACPLLKQGSVGDAVKFLQSKVGASVDGQFGVQTKALVMTYQRNHGLVADGVVGQNTWRKLLGL